MGVYNMSAIGDGGPGGGEIRLGTEATEGSSTASKASDIKSAMESKPIDAKVSFRRYENRFTNPLKSILPRRYARVAS